MGTEKAFSEQWWISTMPESRNSCWANSLLMTEVTAETELNYRQRQSHKAQQIKEALKGNHSMRSGDVRGDSRRDWSGLIKEEKHITRHRGQRWHICVYTNLHDKCNQKRTEIKFEISTKSTSKNALTTQTNETGVNGNEVHLSCDCVSLWCKHNAVRTVEV